MSGEEKKVVKERLYSEFWSNREYKFVTEGEVVNTSVPSMVRRKIMKVAKALKEGKHENAINNVAIAELIDGIANVLKVNGETKKATVLEKIADELRSV